MKGAGCTSRLRVAIRRGRAACLSCALLAATLSCAAPRATPPYPPGPTSPGGPTRGGKAIFVREEDPDYLDPALSYGTYTGPLSEAIFHTLLDYTDAPGIAGYKLIPDLAESLPDVREGGTLYCFKVRKDARFGSPLHRHITAADFKYAIERLFKVSSPGVTFYGNIVGGERALAGQDSVLPGVIARGDSLYIRIRKPDPVFVHILSMTFTSPMAREIVDKYPNATSQHTVATGPFEVAEFVPRRHVLLVRNRDYCGVPAFLDTFEMRLGVTALNGVAMIRKGLVDGGIFEVPASEYVRLRKDPFWKQQLGVADPLLTEYLYMNCQRPPFDDVRVRQAVCWALDRRALVKVYSGKAVPAGELLPPGMPGAVKLGRYDGPDPARSRELLRQAGYPNGLDIKLYGWTTEPGPRELSIIQKQLEEAGIRVKLDLGEAGPYSVVASDTSRHLEFGIYSWSADYPNPSNFFDVLLNGKRITARHNNNLSRFDDPAVNALIERALVTLDDSQRTAIWQEVDRKVMDKAAVAMTIHYLDSRLYAPRLGGWYRHITRILKLDKLYIKSLSPAAPVAAAGKERS